MNKNIYQTPDILVNELQMEGVLCQSGRIEKWETSKFSWDEEE